jgi:hypothetical protein
VGPTPNNQYAREVVEILRSQTAFAQQLRTESSTFVSAAIGRIALCLKLDFIPHLDYFFGHLERAVRRAVSSLPPCVAQAPLLMHTHTRRL